MVGYTTPSAVKARCEVPPWLRGLVPEFSSISTDFCLVDTPITTISIVLLPYRLYKICIVISFSTTGTPVQSVVRLRVSGCATSPTRVVPAAQNVTTTYSPANFLEGTNALRGLASDHGPPQRAI